MTDLSALLSDLHHQGVERAADIPESERARVLYAWSQDASLADLVAVFAPPLHETRDYEYIALHYFGRFGSRFHERDRHIPERLFFQHLDAHVWRQVEPSIDAELWQVKEATA